MISRIILKKWTSILDIIGSVQFIILTSIAMFFYTGGTYVDPTTTNYQFLYNVFSDLGRTIAHSGNSNRIAFILFFITLSIWGFLQIPFFITFTFLFKQSKNLRILSYIGSLLGIIAGICYIGIAFTPSNLLYQIHDFFVIAAFSSIFISIIIYSITIYQSREFSNFYAIILIISALILGIYFVLLYFNLNIRTPEGLLIQAAGQKIMIYTLLICSIMLGYGSLKYKLS
ncbi:MAG: hypothetical protein ACFE9X_15745 [Promethearchaeota archaeon]